MFEIDNETIDKGVNKGLEGVLFHEKLLQAPIPCTRPGYANGYVYTIVRKDPAWKINDDISQSLSVYEFTHALVHWMHELPNPDKEGIGNIIDKQPIGFKTDKGKEWKKYILSLKPEAATRKIYDVMKKRQTALSREKEALNQMLEQFFANSPRPVRR